MAKTPRTWTGARTPSGLKRVRQAQSRHEVLQPRRTAAKTYVAKALAAVAQPADSSIDPVAALAEALSALDRAAKVGAIHPNAAARRKSRLTLKVNAALGGEHVQTGGRVVKTTGKAAAAKAAKARIAAGKAGKAKGAQTAAGKARAALSKTARAEAAAAKAAAESSAASAEAAPTKTAAPRATKAAAAKKPAAANKKAAAKAPASKAGAKKAAKPKASKRPSRRQGAAKAARPRSGLRASTPRVRRAGVPPPRRVAGSGGDDRLGADRLGPEEAVERRPAQAAKCGQEEHGSGAAELLAPVERRERRGIGHAGGHEVRAAPGVEVPLVDAVGPGPNR